MARGESEASERKGTGAAIWAVFGVACLFAAYLVVDATSESGSDPYDLELREPFAGAESTLRVLNWRGCTQGTGPVVPGPTGTTDPEARIDRELTGLGYVSASDWSEPRPLPIQDSFPDLVGGCGVVAVSSDGHGLTHTGTWPVCSPSVTTAAACGIEDIRVFGTGMVRTRVYLMPGLSDTEAAATGMPSEALMAHAEAETILGRSGWRAAAGVSAESLLPRTGSHSLIPPARPGSGCVPYVAVGVGVGNAQATWLGRNVGWTTAQQRFVMGAIACSGAGMFGNRTTEISAHDANLGGTVYWRPYDASAGPAASPTTPVTTVGAARLVSGATLTLPPTVDDQFDD